jgi:transcription initiation factor TFIIB
MVDCDNPIWDEAFSSMSRLFEDVRISEPDGLVKGPVKGNGDYECVHCERSKVDLVEGNMVCMTCYSVVGRHIDYGAEWRHFGADNGYSAGSNNPARCCPPSNGMIASMGGRIVAMPGKQRSQWQNRTAESAGAEEASSAAAKSVQRFHMWNSMTYRDRVLCGVFESLTLNAAQNGLSACILEEAKALYKRLSEARITRGDNRKAVIAASVYVACKNNRVPRSNKEIAHMFDIPPSALTKACKIFNDVVPGSDDTSSCADDYVSRFCCRLGFDTEFAKRVRTLTEDAADDDSISGSMPTSVVAGAIAYLAEAEGTKIDKKTVAKVCGVAPTTVSKIYKTLLAFKKEKK